MATKYDSTNSLNWAYSQLLEAGELLSVLPPRGNETAEDMAAQVLTQRIFQLVQSACSALDEHQRRCTGEGWKVEDRQIPDRTKATAQVLA